MRKIALLSIALIVIGITMLGCPGNGANGNGSSGSDYVPPPSPAAFSLSNLSIAPALVSLGETVAISISVTNSGGSQGNYDVILNINEALEESKSVTLSAGASQTVIFNVTMGKAGTFTAMIGNLSHTFTVATELIVFWSQRDGGNNDIWVMNADGTGVLRQLTKGTGANQPSWSPNGQKIVFISGRDGDAEIYVMNADGSGQLQLTDNNSEDFDPRWSPDGQKIVFRSDRDGDFDIYVMNADGTGVVQLTDFNSYEAHPSWSPDGQKIVFASGGDGDFELWVMKADGTSLHKLTDNTSNDYQPSWSPDGQKIVFVSQETGDQEIFVMWGDFINYSYRLVVSLTDNPASDISPAWSPDGQKIVFSSDRDGDYDIYVMNADGTGEVVQLTNHPSSDDSPSWSSVGNSNEAGGETGIPGGTIADLQLQQDVLSIIMIREIVRDPNCTNPRVINSEVTELTTADGKWGERWTLDSCGVTVAYDILFTPDGQGGTYFAVTRAEIP